MTGDKLWPQATLATVPISPCFSNSLWILLDPHASPLDIRWKAARTSGSAIGVECLRGSSLLIMTAVLWLNCVMEWWNDHGSDCDFTVASCFDPAIVLSINTDVASFCSWIDGFFLFESHDIPVPLQWPTSRLGLTADLPWTAERPVEIFITPVSLFPFCVAASVLLL